MADKIYAAIDLNNAENEVMPILIPKVLKYSKISKNIGITNHISP